MLSIPLLKPYLLHAWKFKRTINHLQDNQTAKIKGTVCLNLMSGSDYPCRYLYCERGIMHQGAYSGSIEQTYQFSFKEGGGMDVYFRDGRFFYHLDLTKGKAEIEHQCGEDMYLGQVEVISQTQYQYIWNVKGPRKHYRTHTIFSRISP